MSSYIEKLNDWLAENEPKGCPIWAMLFWSYIEENPISNEKIRSTYSWLDQKLEHLTLAENDRFWNSVSDLCLEQEQAAFYAGLQAGIRLERELAMDKKSV